MRETGDRPGPTEGFTLIEVVLALVILEFGMLALAATGAVAAREMAAARAAQRARDVARERVDKLRLSACQSSQSGNAQHPLEIRESWLVETHGPLRLLRDEVTVGRGRAAARVALERWMWCGY